MAASQEFLSSNVNSLLPSRTANLRASSRALEIVTAILKKRHDERRLELLEERLHVRNHADRGHGTETVTRRLVDEIIAARA